MDESEKYFAFESGFTVPNEDQEFEPLLLVSKDPFLKINPSGNAPPSPDFMMCASTGFGLSKAYFARFVHPKHQVESQICILVGKLFSM